MREWNLFPTFEVLVSEKALMGLSMKLELVSPKSFSHCPLLVITVSPKGLVSVQNNSSPKRRITHE